jgi:hypothetical protein
MLTHSAPEEKKRSNAQFSAVMSSLAYAQTFRRASRARSMVCASGVPDAATERGVHLGTFDATESLRLRSGQVIAGHGPRLLDDDPRNASHSATPA